MDSDLEGDGSGLLQAPVPEFTWRYRGKTRKSIPPKYMSRALPLHTYVRYQNMDFKC